MKRIVRAAAGIALGLALVVIPIARSHGAEFTVNPSRFDPYKQHKFRVKWDGRFVPGIVHVSGLGQSTEVVPARPGTGTGAVRKAPGATSCGPIVIERGRTHDTTFEQWAAKVFNATTPAAAPGQDIRKDFIVDLLNEAGQLVMSYKVYRAWPSRYEPIKELDANKGEPALEVLTLECETFERDTSVVEPKEPSFN
jgi:phage tail-like protein